MDGSFLPTVFHVPWIVLRLQEHAIYSLFSFFLVTQNINLTLLQNNMSDFNVYGKPLMQSHIWACVTLYLSINML